jgi:hypothetical protein
VRSVGSAFAFSGALALVTMGCFPAEHPKRAEIYPTTAAPPARVLEIVNKDERHAISVSRGVAFGVAASDDCPGTAPPPTLVIADESVLKLHAIAKNASKREWVLWGAKAGQTTVTVRAECATQVYEVTVVAP